MRNQLNESSKLFPLHKVRIQKQMLIHASTDDPTILKSMLGKKVRVEYLCEEFLLAHLSV